jgi:hypothetical protein
MGTVETEPRGVRMTLEPLLWERFQRPEFRGDMSEMARKAIGPDVQEVVCFEESPCESPDCRGEHGSPLGLHYHVAYHEVV